MTLLLLVVLAGVVLAIGSTATIGIYLYRLRAASQELESHPKTGQYARAILLGFAGLFVACLSLFWSYGKFITLRGQ